MEKYINYILILKKHIPIDIIWIIMRFVYNNIKIASSPHATHIFIYDDDIVYGFGDNKQGELGLGHNNQVTSLQKLNVSEKKEMFIHVGIIILVVWD